MAELIHTICFRASTLMREELRKLAGQNRRKLGDVVRLLLEWALEERKKNG